MLTLSKNPSGLPAIDTTIAEFDKPSLIAVPILFLDFPSLNKWFSGANININLLSGAVMNNAGTYVGVGGISAVSTSEESIELKSQKLTVEINGIDSTFMALVLSENYFGREATFGLVTLDSSTSLVQGEPIILFKGFMSVLSIEMDTNTKIIVEIESILANWERPRVKRYNTSTQQGTDVTDKGFNNVASLIHKEIKWGR